MMAHWHAN
ncbi:hypothetical protein F383_18402 [Gossypium arboreum]|uniref:Uncharacterized protein n=1 Tax=Gossypium arboreum TaxID=29729 RepID=A0A0B0NBT9_GOSAR|nr:hypothetical protein F383_18402 [Gossypium arboreum]